MTGKNSANMGVPFIMMLKTLLPNKIKHETL